VQSCRRRSTMGVGGLLGFQGRGSITEEERVQPFQGMAGEARSAYPLRIIYASERLGSEGFNRCRLDMRGIRLGPPGAPWGYRACGWKRKKKKSWGRA
jgi:hypothetical protein